MIWKKLYISEIDITIEVSDQGHIKTLDKIVEVSLPGKKSYFRNIIGKIKSPVCNGKAGYYQVALHNKDLTKRFYIQRLVWMAFNGQIPNNMEIDHIDSDKSNNALTNLQLVTRKQNMNKMLVENPHIIYNLKNQ